MKSLVFLCGMLAVCAGAAVRQKRGWSSGWNTALDALNSGWSTGVGTVTNGWRGSEDYHAPAEKVIFVKKVVNVQREVTVPQVVHVRKIITEPRVVTVKKIVPVSTGYIPSGLYSGGYSGRYAGGYSGGFTAGSGGGWW
ncbi:unnamed protein product [Arctia plantaginis]|uniref:Uncharacterized protein n=1 Tax=Arctia plantaginis TaxID=874455 RepID=A0A8S0Z702_ARCPL|nr:unnamed protein product [Arctia plantaginis]CAB3228178.1 unnamed protein product [Arctia plantaginis]